VEITFTDSYLVAAFPSESILLWVLSNSFKIRIMVAHCLILLRIWK
jgi:hypothetical protein